MFYVRIGATDLTVGCTGVGHNVVGNEVAREGESLRLSNISPFAACKVRGRRGKVAAGKAEVLQVLSPSLAMGGAFFFGAVIWGPGLRVARSPIFASEGMSPFVPSDALVSRDPLQDDVQMAVGCHVGCQLVMDVCGEGVRCKISEGILTVCTDGNVVGGV